MTGPAEAVDRFVAGHTVLGERRLGRTKSATVYGGLDEHHRREARDAGLDLDPIALQDLFIHLTQPSGGPRCAPTPAAGPGASPASLLATHLPFLALAWVVSVAAVLVLTVGIAVRGDVTGSVWDPAVSVVRWFALGYGLFLINRLLAVYVAHGRTRREFLGSVAVFVVVAGAAVAALLAAGFALEAVLYRAMDWPHRVSTGPLPGAALTWLLVRDVPIRPKSI